MPHSQTSVQDRTSEMATFSVARNSTLLPAMRHVLAKCGAAPIEVSDTFSVRIGGATYLGVQPMLTVLARQSAEAAAVLNGPSATSATAAGVRSWVSLALQVATDGLKASDLEPLLPTATFVAGTAHATVADALLYAAMSPRVSAQGARPADLPNYFKWLARVEKDPLLAGLRNEEGTTEPQAAGGAGGKVAPARPSSDEIAARRAEKEKAKADKAAKLGGTPDSPAAPTASATAATAPVGKKSPVQPQELDIRVGLIRDVQPHPKADKLFVEQIDLGESTGPRTIVSGLVAHYKAEELLNRRCLVVSNMKPRALMGVESAGMVLCASSDTAGLELLSTTDVGTRVAYGEPTSARVGDVPVLTSSTRTGDLLAPLRSDGAGNVMWGDLPLFVGGATVTTRIVDGVVK